MRGEKQIMEASIESGADAVEIHTGEYAMAFQRKQPIEGFFDQFALALEVAKPSSLLFHVPRSNQRKCNLCLSKSFLLNTILVIG